MARCHTVGTTQGIRDEVLRWGTEGKGQQDVEGSVVEANQIKRYIHKPICQTYKCPSLQRLPKCLQRHDSENTTFGPTTRSRGGAQLLASRHSMAIGCRVCTPPTRLGVPSSSPVQEHSSWQRDQLPNQVRGARTCHLLDVCFSVRPLLHSPSP